MPLKSSEAFIKNLKLNCDTWIYILITYARTSLIIQTYTKKFLTTLEEAHRIVEKENFDNVEETAEPLPMGYPVNGSVDLNEKIALLSSANGTEIGPSIVLPVQRGDKVSLQTDYFYTEDAPGASYDNLSMLVNEVLLSLAASGAGVLQLTEGQLIDLASGVGGYTNALGSFFSSNFDTTDVSKPHGYLIWMLYDNDMKLVPSGSGAKRVTNPNSLEQLLRDDIPVVEDGYLHAYVTNGSEPAVSFDNFLLTYLRGSTRQINHYYPYGLSIDGLDHSDEYLNKYTSKELQTGEFIPVGTSGLEMFDFGSRFYDPQLGRWTTPDPAEQFANPYLAMGNNPVMYVDPDGEWILTASMIAISAISGGLRAKRQGGDIVDGVMRGLITGGTAAMLGSIGGGGLPFIADLGIATAQGAAIGAMDAYLWDENMGKSALWGGVSAATMLTLTSPQLRNALKGKKFRTNQNVFMDFSSGKYTKNGGVWQQDAINYFGFKGTYDPELFDLLNLDAAGFIGRDELRTKIFYNKQALESYDNLRAVYTKENFYTKMSYDEFMSKSDNLLEYEGFVHAYENQGLYRKNNFDLLGGVNTYGNKLKGVSN